MGFSGRVAGAFQDNQLTPLLALAAMLLGLFAVLVTPREEEPQISVPLFLYRSDRSATCPWDMLPGSWKRPESQRSSLPAGYLRKECG